MGNGTRTWLLPGGMGKSLAIKKYDHLVREDPDVSKL